LTLSSPRPTIAPMNLGLGYAEIIIILLFALIVIGPRRLPEFMRQMGRIMGQLRRASDDIRREILFSEDISQVKSSIRDAMDPMKVPDVPPRLKRKAAPEPGESEQQEPGTEVEESVEEKPDE